VKWPDFDSYAAKLNIMALFTVVLDFAGGTYISQFRAVSVRAAAAKHASKLVGNKALCTLAIRRRLGDGLSAEKPIAIAGVRNVWCCSASVGKKFALVNFVATAES
jgi:hypothetical protein